MYVKSESIHNKKKSTKIAKNITFTFHDYVPFS